MLEDNLVLARFVESVLAPSSGDTLVPLIGLLQVLQVGQADDVDVSREDKLVVSVEQSHVVGQVPLGEARVNRDVFDLTVLMLNGLDLLLSVPLTTSNHQWVGASSGELIDTMSSGHDDTGSDERATADIEVLVPSLLQDGTHVGPFTELGRGSVLVILDPDSDAVDVPGATLGHVGLGLGGHGVGVVRVTTTDLQVAFAFGVFGIQRNVLAKVASDINQTRTSVGDDFSQVITLVVGHALVAVSLVVQTLFTLGINLL